ncbi:MAG: sigma-70 family RNA polymerase sigma factor [Flavobacteriales bacterium]|nr:sigma-70 family RNA polymerase sigma factor [Flavobacteriales bacterium]
MKKSISLFLMSRFVSKIYSNLYSKKISEEELIKLLQENSEEGISLLYDNYSAILYGIITKIVRSENIAEDILQDTFVKIWKNFSSYDSSKGRLFTWMLNIARNKAIDYIRSKEFKNRSLNESDINNKSLSEISSEMNTDQIGLSNTLKFLNPKNKIVIDIIYFKGYTQVEAAKYLNIPLGTVKSRVRNGLIELRKYIK